jgi:fucose permease
MITNRSAITGTLYTSMFFLGIVIAIVGAAARNIGLSSSQIGILVSVQNIGFMVGVLIASSLADSISKTRIMLMGSVMLMTSFAFFYAFRPFGVNVAVMLVMGVGIGSYEGTSDSVLLDLYDRNESLYININHMFVTVGSLVVTVYLVFLQMNWRNSMLQAAVAVLVLAVVFLFSRIESGRHVTAKLRDRLAQFAGRPAFVVCFVLLFIAVGAQMTVMSITTTYLMQHRGHDQITSKIAAVLYLSGVGFGRVLIGYLTRKGRIYRTLASLFPANVVVAFIYFGFDTGSAVYPLALLLGLTMSGALPLVIATVGLVYREVSGTAVGLMKLAIPTGGIVVPLVLAAVAEVLPLPSALMLIPLLFLVGGILLFAARRHIITKATF